MFDASFFLKAEKVLVFAHYKIIEKAQTNQNILAVAGIEMVLLAFPFHLYKSVRFFHIRFMEDLIENANIDSTGRQD